MANKGKGHLFKRKVGKYLVYLPLSVADDSMFPFKVAKSTPVKVSFKVGDNKHVIEERKESEK